MSAFGPGFPRGRRRADPRAGPAVGSHPAAPRRVGCAHARAGGCVRRLRPRGERGSSLEQHRARIRAVDRHARRSAQCCARVGSRRLGHSDIWAAGRKRCTSPTSDEHAGPAHATESCGISRAFETSEIVELDGYLVTDLTRTLVDLARTTGFLERSRLARPRHAIRVGALRGGAYRPGTDHRTAAAATRRPSVESRRCQGPPRDRVRRPRRGIAWRIAEPRSDAPARLPAAAPAGATPRPDGAPTSSTSTGPSIGLFGEFDGHGKYLSRQVHARQDHGRHRHRREGTGGSDRLRHRPRGVRWDWKVALDARRLARPEPRQRPDSLARTPGSPRGA